MLRFADHALPLLREAAEHLAVKVADILTSPLGGALAQAGLNLWTGGQ